MHMIDWINANSGFVIAALTFAYVVATFALLLVMVRGNRLVRRNIETITMIERQRGRPYVVVDMPLIEGSPHFRVHNSGLSTAHEIRIELTPPLYAFHYVAGLDAKPILQQKNIPMISEGIASLHPQQKLFCLVAGREPFDEKYPMPSFTGTVSYKGSDGHRYTDPIRIDLRVHEGMTHSVQRGPYDWVLREIAETLNKIEKTIEGRTTGSSVP